MSLGLFGCLIRLLRHRVRGERMHGGGDDVRDDDGFGIFVRIDCE